MLPIDLDKRVSGIRAPERKELLFIESSENKYFYDVRKQSNFKYARNYSLEISRKALLKDNTPCFYCGSSIVDIMPAFLHDGSGHNLWMYKDWRCSVVLCKACNFNYKHRGVKYIKRFDTVRPSNLRKVLSFEPEILIPTLEPVHLHFHYSENGILEPKTVRAERTIDLFALNRPELVERRRDNSYIVRSLEAQVASKKSDEEIFSHRDIARIISKYPMDSLFGLEGVSQRNRDKFLNVMMASIKSFSHLYPRELERTIPFKSITYKLLSDVYSIDRLRKHRFSGIDNIEFYGIRNFDGIQKITFNGRSSVIIVGENGVGKSTLLELFKRCLKPNYKKNVNDLITRNIGRYESWYAVQYNNAQSSYKYCNNRRAKASNERCYLVHISDSRSSSKGSKLIIDFLNKYESDTEVVDWVIKQTLSLLDFPNHVKIDYQAKNVFIYDNGNMKYLHELSSGYNSILSIFGLILNQISKGFNEINISGIYKVLSSTVVLIDEVELHLHPKFKKNIISLLKSSFPEVIFVFTTHDPMVLSSSEKEDVVLLLEKDEKNNRTKIRTNLPDHSELTTEQILSSPIFGLKSFSFDCPERLISEYYSALNSGDRDTAKELRQQLGKIGYFGKTYRDLIAFSAVDAYLSKGMEPDFERILELLGKADRND